MWCSVESLFRHTTLPPTAALAGFGVNAALPTEPTIAIVTCGDGAGAGAGGGDAGEGEGVGDGAGEGDGAGVTDGELGDEYPLPHADKIRQMKTVVIKRAKDITGSSSDPEKTALFLKCCQADRQAPRHVSSREMGLLAPNAVAFHYRARKALRLPRRAAGAEPVPLAV